MVPIGLIRGDKESSEIGNIKKKKRKEKKRKEGRVPRSLGAPNEGKVKKKGKGGKKTTSKSFLRPGSIP